MLSPPSIKAIDQPNTGRDQQSYAFALAWSAPNGRRFDGEFVHRCPTVGETVAIEAAQGRQTDGQSLSENGRDLALMIAHLEMTLKQRPKWAQPVADIPHAELLRAVAEEAAAHLRQFCGHGDGSEASTAVAG